jgi:hypothetical protein
MCISSGTVCRAFEACIDKPKVENCNRAFRREASLRRREQQSDCVFAAATHKVFYRLTTRIAADDGVCKALDSMGDKPEFQVL